MTCRHLPGDPECSSSSTYVAPYSSYTAPVKIPDSKNYLIEKVEFIGGHLVMQVKYPNCSKCAYEGLKTLVFLNVSPIDAMKWREIDPHFADPKEIRMTHQAPSPAARFPGTLDGWNDALEYVKRKNP